TDCVATMTGTGLIPPEVRHLWLGRMLIAIILISRLELETVDERREHVNSARPFRAKRCGDEVLDCAVRRMRQRPKPHEFAVVFRFRFIPQVVEQPVNPPSLSKVVRESAPIQHLLA